MNLYRTSGWFSLAVSLVVILKGLTTSISTTDLDVSSVIVGNSLPVILLYISICLLKAKDRKSSATVASILILIVSLLWLVLSIPGLPAVALVLIIVVNLFMSVVALFIINWYVAKAAGLVVTAVILLSVSIFFASYGFKVLPHTSSGVIDIQTK